MKMLHSCTGTSDAVLLTKFSSSPVDVFTKLRHINGGNSFALSFSKHKVRSVTGGNQHEQNQLAKLPRTSAEIKIPILQLGKIFQSFFPNRNAGTVEVKGTVVLKRKSLLGLDDQIAEGLDETSELLGKRVAVQLVSVEVDPETGDGKMSETANLESWILKPDHLFADKGTSYAVTFHLQKDFGTPGAFLMENHHPNEFFLVSLLLDMPDKSLIVFNCNSWVYNSKSYGSPRIFFSNQVYLPNYTPAGLQKLRLTELDALRGDGTGERKESDRIYDYDVYNDLGRPDKGIKYTRPTLGGSKDYPYPRRCRTGRKPTKTDPTCESPVVGVTEVYVPRDEQFSPTKLQDVLGSALQSLELDIIPAVEAYFKNRDNFKSLKEIDHLYQHGVDFNDVFDKTPHDFIDKLTHPDLLGTGKLRYPVPQVYEDNKEAWLFDEEFARQLIAGMNPLVIEGLKVFPPVSSLDPAVYGSPISAFTEDDIADKLGGLTVQEALKQNKLYILDFHDAYLPYIAKINAMEGKIYASRMILYLTEECTLKPIAIELSLPPAIEGGNCTRRVFTPPTGPGVEDSMWRLAKAHVKINDAAVHQVGSHWLRTHACVEPYVIATNRHLSAMHPINALLTPHYKDTMNINSLARQTLIVANAIIERTFPSARYSLEISAKFYKSWRFDQESLPGDLIKRGIAVEDKYAEHGLKLNIADYPYAVDGLDIWFAIKTWVSDYVSIFYKDGATVQEDKELQSWWKEITEVGHGDKKGEPWWLEMKSVTELVEAATTIIWVASAQHAAVNFGQYAYAGHVPNKPTMGRKLIPEEGTEDYEELVKDPETFYLQTIPTVFQAILGMTTVQVLSYHASEEEYLGQKMPIHWINNEKVMQAYDKFAVKMSEIEKAILERNANPQLKNRRGPANVPYTLLLPSSEKGLTGRGIPNSISI